MEEIERCIEARKIHLQNIDPKAYLNQHAQELRKEIAFLDMEVMNIEKTLLSMYKEAYEKTGSSLDDDDMQVVRDHNPANNSTTNVSSFTTKDDDMLITSRLPPVVRDYPAEKYTSVCGSQPPLHSSIQYRSRLSLSQNASYRTSHPSLTNAKVRHSFHSLPFSEPEVKSIDHVRQTPNRLSEEMVKCITTIYCQLAEPSLFYYGSPTYPISFSSSMSESPPHVQYDRSPQHRRNSSYNAWLSNPLHFEDSEEMSCSYPAMVEIQGICLDASRLTSVEQMLKKFRSLVSKLEKVDPRKLKHEEKLAFWINVHNVLVMHVFLVDGIPQNNLKRNSLVIEAAYNIGGHTISVDMIQNSILGCQMPRPRQWLQSLFYRKSKFKHGDVGKAYAVGCPQPLVKFALTSGSYSDPMVRIYTPKRLLQELESAKQEYLQTTCKIENERKICLPKIVESYAKELGLSSAALFEMIAHSTSYYILQKCIHQPHEENKLCKNIEWMPHNFNFRYLFAPELAKMI